MDKIKKLELQKRNQKIMENQQRSEKAPNKISIYSWSEIVNKDLCHMYN